MRVPDPRLHRGLLSYAPSGLSSRLWTQGSTSHPMSVVQGSAHPCAPFPSHATIPPWIPSLHPPTSNPPPPPPARTNPHPPTLAPGAEPPPATPTSYLVPRTSYLRRAHLWLIAPLALIWIFMSQARIEPFDFWWNVVSGRIMAETGRFLGTDVLVYTP